MVRGMADFTMKEACIGSQRQAEQTKLQKQQARMTFWHHGGEIWVTPRHATQVAKFTDAGLPYSYCD